MGDFDGCTMRVVNWEKYNPRTDTKRPSWFRLENDLAFNSTLFGASIEQKWLWIVILSLQSKHNGREFKWNSRYIQAITGISLKTQSQAIEMFTLSQNLCVTRTDLPVELKVTRKDLHATNERTNKTNEQDVQDEQQVPRDEMLRNVWNKNRGSLSECRELSDKRRKAARALLLLKPDENYWVQVVQKIAASKFCNGGGSTGWRADFDWLLRPDTHLRVLEGKYDDAQKPQTESCTKCDRGLIRAKSFSSGVPEWTACNCSVGRQKTNYVRFDETRHERAAP